MKTAKITSIHQIKPWNGPNGTVYYHWLEMDNGDLIDIGKKKELKVGWDITYEITDTQHKYNKAKTVKPEGGFPKKSDDNLLGIKIGHALNCASVLLSGKISDYKKGSELKAAIKGTAQMIYEISEEMNAEMTNKPVENTKPELSDEQYDEAYDQALEEEHDLPF